MFKLRLKQLREEGGYSQNTFAQIFGVAQSTVGNWESGTREPNLEMIKKLADFFGVSFDYLLGREEQPRPNESFSTSPAEQQLIKKYRSLPQERQKTVSDLINTLVTTVTAENKKNGNIPPNIKTMDDLDKFLEEHESQQTVIAAYGGDNMNIIYDQEKQDKLDELIKRIEKLEKHIEK